ncbi:uncharacterized membrane protein At3g27390 isoform X2 [Malania oleifera]|nr:uncharacterized membrane protein At3g27390 isoform X2 [Malania oleifera]
MSIGNTAIIVGLWPAHSIWTYYCIVRAKQLGPILKLVLCICVTVLLILWPLVGIVGSIIGGAAYGLFAPIFATFEAVGEGKTNEFFHCIYDGTWTTVQGTCTVIRDFMDVCFHSYFSLMDDLRRQVPPDGKRYEIRLLHLPGAIIAGVLGVMLDMPIISLIALFKSPYMLFKGWHRLFHDLIGREGPFLETICVPFAGLAILLWPLAVVGAVSGSVVSSIFLGSYAGVVVYQESSFWLGLCYIIASLSLFDEYSNDVLDMPEGSCFPRPQFRKRPEARTSTHSSSFSRPNSFKNPPSHTASLKGSVIELRPLELFDNVFREAQRHGETMVFGGLITKEDIEDSKSKKANSKVIRIGLPAYCLLQALLRSAKANCTGLLLSDNVTEITSTNRPRDTFFDWFLNPLLIIKDQIKAINLSEAEEDYLGRLVLFNSSPEKLNSNIPESERRRAELDALARRLRGITASISRYPTYRRRFEYLVKTLSEDLAKKNGDSKSSHEQTIPRSRNGFARIFSQKSFKRKGSDTGSELTGSDQESRIVEIT